MIKAKFNLKKIFGLFFVVQIIIATAIFSLPLEVKAQKAGNEIKALDFTPQVTIPGVNGQKPVFDVNLATPVGTFDPATGRMNSDLLAKYILAFYNYALAIVGAIATIVLMGAGIIWLTSGGDPGKVGQAKTMIGGSIVGIVLLVCSWIILNTINPNLTKFAAIKTTNINLVEYGCCDQAKDDGKTKMTTSNNCKTGFSIRKTMNPDGKCEGEICCVITYTDNYKKNNLLATCVNTLAYSCVNMTKEYNRNSSNGIVYSYEKKDAKCEGLSNCVDKTNETKILSCAGVSDAEKLTFDVGNKTAWCYNQRVYYGDTGIVGEPCGNEQYSKCCGEYWGSTIDIGGRSCCSMTDSGCTRAWCCKYDSSGKKI